MTSMSFIEGPHPLLEEQPPSYTNSTIRRAFIVWMYLGQRNSFKDVCKYYHQLESLEEKMPADRRTASRQHEFNMFSKPPPSSPYLDELLPNLYSQNTAINNYIKQVDIKNEDSILDLKEHAQNGSITNDILETSDMIKKYCKSHMIPISKFLSEFKQYTRKCNLCCTINNVVFYIKRKMVEEELLMVENYTKCWNFLSLNMERTPPVPVYKPVNDKVNKMSKEQLKFLSSINAKKPVTILTRKTNAMHKYWNDLTSEMSIRNNCTKAW